MKRRDRQEIRCWLLLLMVLTQGWLLTEGKAQMAVGTWRDCFDFRSVQAVAVAEGRVYAASRSALFSYDPSADAVSVLGKSNGMSDVGISAMAYDAERGVLAVAYDNANIDLVEGGRVHNIPDIKRSGLVGDKSVYGIAFHGGNAYLATGFGLVVVDLSRHEISQTCYLGQGGEAVGVYGLALSADSLYAATAEGVKIVSLGERYMGISDRWRTEGRLSAWQVRQVAVLGGEVLVAGQQGAADSTTLLRLIGDGTVPLLTAERMKMRVSQGLLVVSTPRGVWMYDTNMAVADSATAIEDWAEVQANDAEIDGEGMLWVAHSWLGLVGLRQGEVRIVRPEGPETDDKVFRLVPTGRGMLLCPGGHTTTYANSYLEVQLPRSVGRGWQHISDPDGLLPAGATDVVDACINPKDTNELLVALWGSGVASVREGRVAAFYDESNTGGALSRYTVGTFSTLRTGALAADRRGNVWVLCSNSGAALAVRKADGQWQRFSTEALGAQLEVDRLIADSLTGYLWFAGRDNAIYVHDGVSRMARVNPNSGSKLQTESVNAMVQDRNGHIWVGTNKGIKVIYEGSRVFVSGGRGEVAPISCSNITITNGAFYEYLMAYETVTAMAVDGANRKWVGTAAGGLYLLSANGMEQLQHFTAADSPLLSDKIVALGVQPESGEVYIGTDAGLQVYRSTATYAESAPKETIYAFPNPVRPGYEGPVAIKGLTRDAMVHITDAAGHTVFSTQAYGGQAIWNGRTASGERVASGVYYVFAADSEGGNRTVTKILVLR